MKILFIHEVNYETKVIFEIQEFPELLALRGNQVDFFQFPEGVGIRNFSLKSKFKKIHGRVYPDSVINLITPPTIGGSFIDRLLSTFTAIPILWKLISKENYDVVVIYAVPTSGWQAALIAKFKGVPTIFRALDVSHLLRSGLTKRLVFKAEKVVYKNVNLISANNQALAEYCREIGGNSTPTSVNPPPLDLKHFTYESNSSISRTSLGIADSDFLLVFMGTFYEFSGIPKVIKHLAELEDSTVKIILVGGGVQEDELRKLTKEYALEKQVIFTGVVSYEDLPSVLKLADAAFNSFEPILIANVAFPHKVLQYLAAGLPTISTKLDGLYSSLGDNAGVQWVDSPEDVMAKALEIRAAVKADLERDKVSGQLFIKTRFNKDDVAIGFEHTIESIVKNGL